VLESSHFGSDRARLLAPCIWRQYKNISFLDGMSRKDFALHLVKMLHELEI
jgi:hypothetical protein